MYDENSNLIGVDKAVASSILIYFKEKGWIKSLLLQTQRECFIRGVS